MKKTLFWALMLMVSMTACKGGKGGDAAATEDDAPETGLVLNEKNFPDPLLLSNLAEKSEGIDGILSDRELEEFWLLDANYEGLEDLTGIELLPNLSSLHMNGFKGTTIDVSKNTKLKEIYCCDSRNLTSLILGELPELETLNINGTSISDIDLTQCPKLKTLRFKGTPISTIDLSGCPELEEIECDPLLIPDLDLSACPNAAFAD